MTKNTRYYRECSLSILMLVASACGGRAPVTVLPPMGPTGVCGANDSAASCAGSGKAAVGAISAAAAIQRDVIAPTVQIRQTMAGAGGTAGDPALRKQDGAAAAAVAGAPSLQAGANGGGGASGSGPLFPRIPKANPAGGGGGGSGSSNSKAGVSLAAAGLSATKDAASAAAVAAPVSDPNVAAAVAAGARGAGGGGSGGAFNPFAGLGEESGSGEAASASRFGEKPDVAPVGSEDPNDYFSRLGLNDSLFQIVEKRYRNQAVNWARVDSELVVKKAKSH